MQVDLIWTGNNTCPQSVEKAIFRRKKKDGFLILGSEETESRKA